MIRKLTIYLVLVALGLTAAPVQAFFDDVEISPRARGMGESAVAVPGGPYAAFLNPGLLGSLSRSEVTSSYVQPFSADFLDLFYLGGAVRLRNDYGSVGIGVSSFQTSYQDVDLNKETRISLAHGLNLYQDYHSSIDLGYSLNVYRVEQSETVSGLDPGDDTAIGVDFGMVMTLHKRTRLGFLVQNLNNPNIGLDEEELGRALIAGISYEPYEGVTTTFEFDNELGEEVQYHGGIEFEVAPGFDLRAGIITNPSKLTAGFGYALEGFALNYGFSTGGGTLETTHQFGLNYAWGGEAP